MQSRTKIKPRLGKKDGAKRITDKFSKLRLEIREQVRLFLNRWIREQDWRRCHECQIRLGGKLVTTHCTVSAGKCSMCELDDKTLIPNDDYTWPDKNAVWD